MASVDDQLNAFEDSLRAQLVGTLVFHFDLEQWLAANEPAADDLMELDRVFREVFNQIQHKYRGTPVEDVLHRCRTVLGQVAWAAINVPMTHAIGDHLMAVVDNIIQVYIALFYADLRTEMIMVNHNSQVIQRSWKRAVSNPRHSLCRRRLLREFDALAD